MNEVFHHYEAKRNERGLGYIEKSVLKTYLFRKFYIKNKKKLAQMEVEESYKRKDNIDKLRDDFYSITFMSYVYVDDPKEISGIDSDKLQGKKLSESEVSRNFMNCTFIFIIQMCLVYFSFTCFFQ